jgi:hypothetical protein
LSLAVDHSGNTLVAGVFSGTIPMGSSVLACTLGGFAPCGFIAKIDAVGSILWSRAFVPSTGDVEQTLVAIGPGDEVIVAGGFAGTVDFGSGSIGGAQPSVYLSTFDADGKSVGSITIKACNMRASPASPSMIPAR